jgi:elongation factor Ts
MEITASAVKELRERTGAGMMECKKALTQNQGDMNAAAEWLRKQGLAKADKKATRVAAEGRIALAQDGARAVLVELNCETDFVAKDENFVRFAQAVAEAALAANCSDPEAIKALRLADGSSVEETRQALVAKIGENIQVRRAALLQGESIGSYVHSTQKLGVLVHLKGGSGELARGIAMHVAALNPSYLSFEHVPAEVVAKEKEIALAQAKDSAKSPEILEKMIQGKIRKTLAQTTLLGQEYANAEANGQTVEEVLKRAGATVLAFVRLAVGEGIEKKEENFAAEVMAQVAASQG